MQWEHTAFAMRKYGFDPRVLQSCDTALPASNEMFSESYTSACGSLRSRRFGVSRSVGVSDPQADGFGLYWERYDIAIDRSQQRRYIVEHEPDEPQP